MRIFVRTTIMLVLLGAIGACAQIGSPGTAAPSAGAASTRIRSGSAETLQPLLDEAAGMLPAPGAGIALAVIDGDETGIGFAGNPTFAEDTLFEFGSITKVMTANILAQLAEEGVVALDDSVNAYLPAELQGVQWEPVTLANLATHSAGLPRLPSNLNPFSMVLSGSLDDPYAAYDLAKLYDGLSDVEVGAVGGAAEYSNLGGGWLGTILSQQAGLSYGELVRQRLFEPLGMATATADNTWGSGTVAPPLDSNGPQVANWNFDALAGAGAARGSISDALAFLQGSMTACAPASADGVARANCLAQQPTGHRLSDDTEMGLGWLLTGGPGGTAVWHNGGTGGYRTFLGFNPERGTGIVLLSNVGSLDDIDGIGLRYLIGTE